MVMAVVGCNGGKLSPEAQRQLQLGVTSYEQGNIDQSIQRLDTFLAEYGGLRNADEGYYYRGLAHYELGHVNQANRDFTEALDRTRRADMRSRARLALGVLAYDEGDMTTAEGQLRKSLEGLDRSQPPTDRILYHLGASLQRLGQWDEADRYFNELIRSFPSTKLASQASRRVHAGYWTVQVGAFRNADGARTLVSQLRSGGHDAFQWPEHLDGEMHYFVRVGKHQTYAAAAETLPALREESAEAFLTVMQSPTFPNR